MNESQEEVDEDEPRFFEAVMFSPVVPAAVVPSSNGFSSVRCCDRFSGSSEAEFTRALVVSV